MRLTSLHAWALAALAALALPAGADEGTGVDPRVLRALRALHDPEAPPIEELAERIAQAGEVPVDDLLRFLELGRIDAYVGTGADVDPMDGDAQLMNRYQEKLILTVFDQVGQAGVLPALERLLARSQAPDAVAAAILGVGAVGKAGQLRMLFELALPLEEAERVDPRIERALEKGGAAILAEDPTGFSVLAANWLQLPDALVPALVRAVGATSDGRGVELLGQVIAWRPEQALLAVAQLRRLGPAPDPEVNARIAAELRGRLDPLDGGFCRAAILALAELDDFHAVPELLDLLEHAPAVRENALWALQHLVGRPWADSPGWWRLWYEGELEWYERYHPRMSRELCESSQRDKLVSILREYGKRRLFRHDLAREVTPLLSSADRAVRLMAVETLVLLESDAAIPALVELLRSPDESLRDAAWRALQVITGETHPADSPTWDAIAGARA